MDPASKSSLRKLVRERLRILSAEEIATKSARICEKIRASDFWSEAEVVGFFAAKETEPNLESLWNFADAKTIGYPRVNGVELDLISVENPAALQTSRWQLREPLHDESKIVWPAQLDLIFVPGLAFSLGGLRLGRGGGFYDRLLAHPNLRACKIGVCFEEQILPDLPREPHDRAVDSIITDSQQF